MIRTQISLSEQDYQLARKEAKSLGISLAELFRRALRAVLPVKRDKPWMKYAGDIETGNLRSSQEIDDVVYGHKE